MMWRSMQNNTQAAVIHIYFGRRMGFPDKPLLWRICRIVATKHVKPESISHTCKTMLLELDLSTTNTIMPVSDLKKTPKLLARCRLSKYAAGIQRKVCYTKT